MAKKLPTPTPASVIIVCEVLLAIAFAAARGLPNNPPVFLDWFEVLTLIAFLILLSINLWQRQKTFQHNWWNWITLGILAVVFVAALIAGDPIRKTHTEAISFTREQLHAAAVGYDLAVEFTKGSKTEAEIVKEVEKLPPQVREVASKAINRVIESKGSPKSEQEVVNTTVPTIPVTMGSWNCTQAGCSFADSTYVWTISLFDLIMAAVLNGVIMLMGLWIVNSTPKSRGSK